jgi:hypothetical protein
MAVKKAKPAVLIEEIPCAVQSDERPTLFVAIYQDSEGSWAGDYARDDRGSAEGDIPTDARRAFIVTIPGE